MPSRLDLHEELCTILGSRNVYYNPPETVKLKYPCILYSKSKPSTQRGDNINYMFRNRYDITVISTNADSDLSDKLLTHFPYCSFDRTYKSDNLNHESLTIYY